MTTPSRRRLLTGGAVLDALRDRGAAVADALATDRPLPFAGDTVRLETRGMACPWGVVLDPGPPDRALPASDALREVDRLERLLSVYRPDSPVSVLNRSAADAAVPVGAELFALVTRCAELYAATGGAFDPASQSLIALWQTCRQAGRVPTAAELAQALQSSGMTRVELISREPLETAVQPLGSPPGTAQAVPEQFIRFTAPGVGLNFGAVGKGYALDCITAKLTTAGLSDFLVHGGHSSVVARGRHCGQAGWPVGLKNPLFTDESYLLLLLRDQALGTSGSNIQYFRHDGRRYGHILDPRSGQPAEQLLSVSVIAPTAAEADALSTAFYVLGLEKALEYCHTHPGVGAILTPPVERGRNLSPVVCNVPPEQVFSVSDSVDLSRA